MTRTELEEKILLLVSVIGKSIKNEEYIYNSNMSFIYISERSAPKGKVNVRVGTIPVAYNRSTVEGYINPNESHTINNFSVYYTQIDGESIRTSQKIFFDNMWDILKNEPQDDLELWFQEILINEV